VFLSTDHLPTQHWFLKVFPGTVVRQKPFSDDESPLHLTDFGQPRLEQTRDALMDMVLLSSCHAIIHPGNSSFSLCAIYLSDLPATSLIAMQRTRSRAQRILTGLTRLIRWRRP